MLNQVRRTISLRFVPAARGIIGLRFDRDKPEQWRVDALYSVD